MNLFRKCLSTFKRTGPLHQEAGGDRDTGIFEDNLCYTRMIQETILPSEEDFANILPHSFVFFKPRKKVSEDFYWLETSGGKIYVAAGDCGGQGLQGALLGFISWNLLNRAVKELHLTKPSDILNALNEGLLDSISKINNGDLKATVNISIICIDPQLCTLEYAGAFCPVYTVRGNELSKLSPDRFSGCSGSKDSPSRFTNQQMRVTRNDVVYMFSNGYADQFGGPDNKKFKYSRFQQLLLSVKDDPMPQQKRVLEESMEAWMGPNEEQVDDMLVIGIRI